MGGIRDPDRRDQTTGVRVRQQWRQQDPLRLLLPTQCPVPSAVGRGAPHALQFRFRTCFARNAAETGAHTRYS